MSNKIYDILKYASLIFLPALALLYSTLSEIWGLPLGDEVMATIVAICTCLGTFIGIQSATYRKGGK